MNLKLAYLLKLILAFVQLNHSGPSVGEAQIQVNTIEKVTKWQQLEFGFPSMELKQAAIANGDIVGNPSPIDVQPHYGVRNRLRIFITIPRFGNGIPYTLATVTEEQGPKGPYIQAYPNYDSHNRKDRSCDKITSAFRVAINECNQMWVIDSGMIGSEKICPPQLLLFNLENDQLIHRFRFNESTHYIAGASLFITPISVVQDPPPKGNCQQSKIYIADVGYHGLVVYDQATNEAWRIENKFMYPNPIFGTHTIAGETFTLMDGIFALNTDKQNLYFHSIATKSEYSVPLALLNNRTIWQENREALQSSFNNLGDRKSACAASAIDRLNNIYCVTFNPIQLIVWNVNTPYRPKNFLILPANPRHLEFVSGMKVIARPNRGDELWMISIRFQKTSAGTMNPDEPNFRIMKRSLNDIQQTYFPNGKQPNLQNTLIFN